jgi:hypothetical protein
MKPVRPPAAWMNADLILFHGTTHSAALNILNGGVDLAYGKPYTDFGPGFYTTTSRAQAASWAWALSQSMLPPDPPAVLEFSLPREALAQLDALWFVRGEEDADDLWSLIFHCRGGARDHGRPGNRYYDVVVGPLAGVWQQRVVKPSCDQVSFHTAPAVALLNQMVKRALRHPVM